MPDYHSKLEKKTLTYEDMEILKKINNPKVLVLQDDCINSEKHYPNILGYVNDFITEYNEAIRVSKEFKYLKTNVGKILRKLDKKYHYKTKVRQAVIINELRKLFRANELSPYLMYELFDLLSTKNRHFSGVDEVAIMMKPDDFSCPFDCYYCPTQKDMPKSYVREEPAVRRAAQNNFDCAKQVWTRISSYAATGQPADKGEIIILGGTFSSYDHDYAEEFMRDIYYACNVMYDEDKRERLSLNEEAEINKTALFKVIGNTIETRPDKITVEEIKRFNYYKVTRVQLGIQHTDDNILKKINRQCYTVDTIRGMRLLKNAGFKILCHYMPNLPGTTPKKDMKMFDEITSNPDLLADEWKIYPTSITTTSVKDIEDVDTVIEKWYYDGKYLPYSQEELEEVVKYGKKLAPRYIRISRIFRDIPIDNIVGGANVPHMRQKIQKQMALQGDFCKCIRCREIKNREVNLEHVYFNEIKYEAQGGTEYFISAIYLPPPDDPYKIDDEYRRMLELWGYIIGYVRVRINHGEDLTNNSIEELKNSAIIRELHIYGKVVPTYLSKLMNSNTQHRGIGRRLVKMAEAKAIDHGIYKMAIISGAGVRGYYEKLGYSLEGEYMTKDITNIYYIRIVFYILIFQLCVLPWIYVFSSIYYDN